MRNQIQHSLNDNLWSIHGYLCIKKTSSIVFNDHKPHAYIGGIYCDITNCLLLSKKTVQFVML